MSTLKVTDIQHPSATGPAIELDPVDGVVFSAASFDASVITSGTVDAARLPAPPAPLAGIGSNVVSVNKTDVFTTTSTSFTNVTGLRAEITPSTDTSKVMVFVNVAIGSNDNPNLSYRLTRGGSATIVASGQTYTSRIGPNLSADNRSMYFYLNLVFLDSPAVDTQVTYDVQVATSAGTLKINESGGPIHKAVSSITAIEVAP